MQSYRPYAKPTKVRIFLSRESGHPASTHSWPLTECSRLARNSSDASSFQSALLQFTSDMADQFMDGEIIARVLDTYTQWKSLHRPPVRKQIQSVRTIACILTYHPCLTSARVQHLLDRTVSQFFSELSYLFGKCPTFKFAWKIGQRPLATRLRGL